MRRFTKSSLVVLMLLFSAFHTYAQSGGNISGRVLDELGLGLPGANVLVSELENKGAVSDVDGNFSVINIKEGDYKLTVSYIGYKTATVEVSVKQGKTSTVNIRLEPGVQVGDEILILGDRLKGQAKALNQQRTNVNVTNVVAADQIGRFPDANIGDAMKRIPGITMQNDQGEARDIIIRGMAPQLNSVMINGERVPSAEGDNRRVQMDLIPSDMIQTIEVNKAVTPDMDADAIGGSVNLVTRAAPSDFRLSGTLASGYNLLSEKPIWTGSAIVGNRFANDKLGVIFSASINNHDFGSDNVEAVWDEDDNGNAFVEEQDIRKYVVQRVRRSLSLSLDYKLNENNRIFLRTMYNHRDDWENRFRQRFRKISAPDADGVSEAEVRYQTKGGIGNDRVDNRRLEDQRTFNVSLNGDHLFGKLKADWMATYARASEHRPNERYIRYESDGSFLVNNDFSNPEFPVITPVNASSLGLSNLVFDELLEENQYTEEEDFNARLDFELPLSEGKNSTVLKFGGRLRDKTKLRNNRFSEFSPINEADFATLADVETSDESDPDYLPGSEYQVGTFASAEFLGGLDLKNESIFEEEDAPAEYLPSNFTAGEQILAGYAMITQSLGTKWTFIGGLRVESTNIDYTGNQLVLDEDGDADLGQTEEISNSDSYTNLLPGLHAKYDATENLVLRFAWTNTIARPNYFDIAPYREVNLEDNELFEGNPELQPTLAMNFDFMAENYFKSIGLVSAGVFYKDISDFIYTSQTQDYVDPRRGQTFDTYFQPLNGGSASLTGFEFSVQRQLDFLPGALKGLGVYANYTFTTSSTSDVRNEDGELRDDLALPGTAEHMLNTSLSFETKKLVLRLSLNYASDYLDEVGSSAFTDRYYDRQLFVDFNASYAFTPQFRVFMEANNLTNQPLRYYQGVRERTMQMEYYNARFNFGLKFDMFGGQ